MTIKNPSSALAGYPTEIQIQGARILYKLSQLNFSATFERMEEGPILRTFYFQPSLDALFSRVSGKNEEIAAALATDSARLYRAGGLLAAEIPRPDRQIIRFDQCLHQMLSDLEIRRMALPLLMGQSPKGERIYADLAAQPHLLIAGSTGSGKSVYLNMLAASLALFRDPKELEFTLVDTKNLDLVLFKGLPHVKEIITDVGDLRRRLEQLLREVRIRTATMSGLARNVLEYNALGYKKFHYKVLIIDELADVMETDAASRAGMDKAERADNPSIAALLKGVAQISRAAGIHIIVATQRPSVKMVTGDSKIGFGDIKANLPARVCFKLPSMADSRVVLDENGAETLLGRGDYLYKVSGSDILQRAHSAFVSMDDIALILNSHEHIRGMYAQIS
jgi:S-DNA-T family DNA segregation ATPase FtsK/SpoIIIE